MSTDEQDEIAVLPRVFPTHGQVGVRGHFDRDQTRSPRPRRHRRQLYGEGTGLKRAKLEGKVLGRPFTLNEKQKLDVRQDLATGLSVSAIARKFATSRQTIMRVRDEGSRSVRP